MSKIRALTDANPFIRLQNNNINLSISSFVYLVTYPSLKLEHSLALEFNQSRSSLIIRSAKKLFFWPYDVEKTVRAKKGCLAISTYKCDESTH